MRHVGIGLYVAAIGCRPTGTPDTADTASASDCIDVQEAGLGAITLSWDPTLAPDLVTVTGFEPELWGEVVPPQLCINLRQSDVSWVMSTSLAPGATGVLFDGVVEAYNPDAPAPPPLSPDTGPVWVLLTASEELVWGVVLLPVDGGPMNILASSE